MEADTEEGGRGRGEKAEKEGFRIVFVE